MFMAASFWSCYLMDQIRSLILELLHHVVQSMHDLPVRPEFFYFLVLGKFLGKPSVGGGNKNKNKIQKFPESE